MATLSYIKINFEGFGKKKIYKSLTFPLAAKSSPNGFLGPLPPESMCPTATHLSDVGLQGWGTLCPFGIRPLKGKEMGRKLQRFQYISFLSLSRESHFTSSTMIFVFKS